MKSTLFGTAVILLFLLSSCKRNYTCECPIPDNWDAIPIDFVIHDTKKDAKRACEATVNAYTEASGRSCELAK